MTLLLTRLKVGLCNLPIQLVVSDTCASPSSKLNETVKASRQTNTIGSVITSGVRKPARMLSHMLLHYFCLAVGPIELCKV